MVSEAITVTDHRQLGNETANQKSNTPLGYVPYGLSGLIVEECDVVCPDCATSEELADEENGAIFGNAEWDYPGPVCEDCNEHLDVNLLVYESQDPELHFRLRMSEELGEYNDCLTIEEIAEKVREEAYGMGWNYAKPIEGEFGEECYPELPNDTADYANNVLPSLRALTGFEDPTGKGTYTESPIDVVIDIFNEDTLDAFHNGYYDRAIGNGFETLAE